MKESILNKIKEFQDLAKSNKDTAKIDAIDSIDINKETSLSRVIKTKEEADLFMQRLRALG